MVEAVQSQYPDTQTAESLRLPPHSVEAEQSVLGGLMLDNSGWDRIADLVHSGDFYRRDHQLIFEAIGTLSEKSAPSDVVTVSEHLEKCSQLDDAGGLAYIAGLAKDTPSAANIKAYAEIVRERSMLRELIRVGGARARHRRGALEFDIPEVKAVFANDKTLKDLVAYPRNDAHRIIEECMIAANIQAARFIGKKRLPFLYRSHAGPDQEKLADLRLFLAAEGLSLGGGKKPKPIDSSRLLAKVVTRDDNDLIETVLLRSLSRAVYETDNAGHFGLALAEYAHFTSPIRRYPDLLVHRAIKHALSGRKTGAFSYSKKEMALLGLQSSRAEQRADDATRQAMDYLKCEYMKDKIGQVFAAVISGVTNFGLFVQIPDKQIEGLVHVSALPVDYYEHDATHHTLTGEKKRLEFRLSDRLQVRVSHVDMDKRKIDFELAGDPPPRKSRSQKRKQKHRR